MGLQAAHLSPCECAGILLALAAPKVDLLGISCVNGNVVSVLDPAADGLASHNPLPPEPPGQHGFSLNKHSAAAAFRDQESAAAVMMKCPRHPMLDGMRRRWQKW